MKLWLLKPVKDWDPWYDKAFGFVVSAESEEAARRIASVNHGDETSEAWINPRETSCVELKAEDFPNEVIIRNFASA